MGYMRIRANWVDHQHKGGDMSPTSNSTSGSIIQVAKPQAGAEVSIASEAGAKLALGFDPASATVSRSGNDLVFDLDDGSKVTLSDFFVVGDQALPSLVFPSGDEVAATDSCLLLISILKPLPVPARARVLPAPALAITRTTPARSSTAFPASVRSAPFTGATTAKFPSSRWKKRLTAPSPSA